MYINDYPKNSHSSTRQFIELLSVSSPKSIIPKRDDHSVPGSVLAYTMVVGDGLGGGGDEGISWGIHHSRLALVHAPYDSSAGCPKGSEGAGQSIDWPERQRALPHSAEPSVRFSTVCMNSPLSIGLSDRTARALLEMRRGEKLGSHMCRNISNNHYNITQLFWWLDLSLTNQHNIFLFLAVLLLLPP